MNLGVVSGAPLWKRSLEINQHVSSNRLAVHFAHSSTFYYKFKSKKSLMSPDIDGEHFLMSLGPTVMQHVKKVYKFLACSIKETQKLTVPDSQ